MTKKIHERVLLDNGQFADFPQRHIDKAVETGIREEVEKPIQEPEIPHGEKGKAEIKATQEKQSKAQKIFNKK